MDQPPRTRKIANLIYAFDCACTGEGATPLEVMAATQSTIRRRILQETDDLAVAIRMVDAVAESLKISMEKKLRPGGDDGRHDGD